MDIMDKYPDRVQPEPNSGCWLWTGGVHKQGYGKFWRAYAHRVSYEMSCEPIPDGMLVRHRCDVTSCVNPSHLELGTYKDNSHDAHNRGRAARNERHAQSLLNWAAVDEIRNTPRSRNCNVMLAAKYGVTVACISDVRCGRSWKRWAAAPV